MMEKYSVTILPSEDRKCPTCKTEVPRNRDTCPTCGSDLPKNIKDKNDLWDTSKSKNSFEY